VNPLHTRKLAVAVVRHERFQTATLARLFDVLDLDVVRGDAQLVGNLLLQRLHQCQTLRILRHLIARKGAIR
jgi:hypothetical protein